MTEFDKNKGDMLESPLELSSNDIDVLNCSVAGNLEKTIDTSIDVKCYFESCVNPGLSSFDVRVLISYLKKIYLNLGRKIKIVEFGCGLSTKVMKSLEYCDVTSFALENLLNDDTDFIKCDIRNNIDNIKKEMSNCDVIFIDADHSYNFAKFYCDTFLSNYKLPVIMHDFLKIDLQYTYGEHCYIVKEYLNKKIHKLYLFTSIAEEKIENKDIVNLKTKANKEEFVKPCLAILIPHGETQ